MPLSLKPLAALMPWGKLWAADAPHADELYAAIMAQARLPIYYQRLGVPDTLDGRFVMLSLYLFAVLHRLKGAGGEAAAMAQALSDRFAADMETVLREIGIGDLSVPKKVRKLVAQGATLLEDYERAVSSGGEAFQEAIRAALPVEEGPARAISARLAPHMQDVLQDLEQQPVEAICQGRVRFPSFPAE